MGSLSQHNGTAKEATLNPGDEPPAQDVPPPREERAARFRQWLTEQIAARGLSMRRVSIACGREATWVAQLLASRTAIPSPDDCRALASVLGAPLVDVLDLAWDIRDAVAAELGLAAARTDLGIDDIPPEGRDEIANFIAYTRAKYRERREQAGNGRGD
jgi:hypothetical protein